jgi:general secretion pathway protein N
MKRVRPTSIAVILWAAATGPLVAADPAPHADGHPAAAAVSPLAAQPLERLSATRERPLFSPTRQPPPPPPPTVAAGPPPPPPPPDVALLAVVMDGEEACAIVRAGAAAESKRVRIGDDIGGWKVGQIEAQKLVLLLDGRRATFTMFTGQRPTGLANAGLGAPAANAPDGNLALQHTIAPNGSTPAAAPGRRTSTRPPHRQGVFN